MAQPFEDSTMRLANSRMKCASCLEHMARIAQLEIAVCFACGSVWEIDGPKLKLIGNAQVMGFAGPFSKRENSDDQR